MELIYIAGTAFVVAFSGAMMPGPLLTVTITETVRRGFIAGPLLILGHGVLELALILALVFGLAAFLTLDIVGKLVALIGGAFLIWMGFGMARDVYRGRISLEIIRGDQRAGGPRGMHPVLAGILVSLANPYWILWWATIGLGYITLSLKQGTAGVASFFGGHIMADLIWYSLISAAVVGGGRMLNVKVFRAVILVCGVFLVFLGGSFVYLGLK
ncbi:MAG TPA: LysE family transporter [Clostridia bacterium]|nr:LysE family transporter [Clostridia bacterium]